MKKTVFSLLSLLMTGFCFAQKPVKTHEIGIFVGCSYYIGDLNPTGHFGPLTQPAAGLIYRYNVNPRFSFKANALMGNIQGDDARTNSPSQQQRNLSFKSYVRELAVEAEFNFLEYKTGSTKHGFTPYIFGGIAGFMFNPEAQLGNQWIDLQPLGTEGQGTVGGGKKYRRTQISLPFGMGLKFSMAKKITLGLEWGLRKTFTGYLDDISGNYADPATLAKSGANAAILADRSLTTDTGNSRVGSQRGNGRNDWYSFAGVILSFELPNNHRPCYSYK
jgi:opacity protein-like surface antigen